MYDEDGNFITDSNIDNDVDDDIDNEWDNQSEEWIVKLTKEEYEALQNKARRADVLKQKTAKYAQQKRQWGNNDEIEQMRADLDALKNEKLSTQITSLYPDADVSQVQWLIQKWLTVEQAVNALYANEMAEKRSSSVGIVGRIGGGASSDISQSAVDMSKQMLWL